MDGNPVAVTFPAPTTTGGTAPISTTCTPASGTSFAVGTTAVACTARDAAQQAASCGLTVSVARMPRLTATNFLAFGDSITEGAVSMCGSATADLIPRFWSFWRFENLIDASQAYPTKLIALLRQRYTAQAPTVVNHGKGGEYTDEGVVRIRASLASVAPQILLLQEGANDINQQVGRGTITTNLRDMVRRGREAGAQVYLGTLLPQRAGACKAGGPDRIASTNDLIRTTAAAEGAVLVDLYSAFGGEGSPLIGADGLHPSAAGYEKIADTFFDVIRQRLEN